MLLDEDPATLIRHTKGNFNILPDKQAVSRVNEALFALRQARELQVREADSALQNLSRQLNTINSHHKETVASHSAAAHASTIATLDTQKFRIAKSASDLEIEHERLSSQLIDLQGRLQELDLQGVEGGENAKRGTVDDEISLMLKVYRGLGIEAERGEGGAFDKVVVRNPKRGDAQVVNLDGKISRFWYANYIWECL